MIFYSAMCLECEFQGLVDDLDVFNYVMGVAIRAVFAINDLYLSSSPVCEIFGESTLRGDDVPDCPD